MKVARIVMQLPFGRDDFNDACKRRRQVERPVIFAKKLSATYRKSRRRYRARVKALLSKAVSCGADVVVFPACALIYETPAELLEYTQGISGFTLLAAGALDLRSKKWPEHIVAFEGARRLPTIDKGPYAFDLAFGRCALAISSSVGKLAEERWVVESPAKPLLVLDMGHQQYTGRYLFTLSRVQKLAAPRSRKRFVVLAWWRWSGGSSTGRWAFPSRPAWSPEGGRLEEKDGDFIDFFDVW